MQRFWILIIFRSRRLVVETEKEKAEEQARDNAGKKMENPKNSRESLSMMVKETLCKK